MLHARKKYQKHVSCTPGFIPENEPVMLFRAQDKYAPGLLRVYARFLRHSPKHCTRKMEGSVLRHARLMRQWQQANPHKVKSPD